MNDHMQQSEIEDDPNSIAPEKEDDLSDRDNEEELTQLDRLETLELKVKELQQQLEAAQRAPLVILERLGVTLVNQARKAAQAGSQTTYSIMRVPEEAEETADTLRVLFNGEEPPVAYTLPSQDRPSEMFPLDEVMVESLQAFRQQHQLSPYSACMVNIYAHR